MPESTPENFTRLTNDVHELGKDLRELKGSIDGLKHAHNVLTAGAGLVAVLLSAAVAYFGAQVSSLNTRADGLVTAVAGVQGELKAINQRLGTLEDIRNRLDNLAAIPPPDAGDQTPSGANEPAVATDDQPQTRVILLGDMAPDELESALRTLVAEKTVDRIVAQVTSRPHSTLTYSSIQPPEGQGSSPDVQVADDLTQFIELVQRHDAQHSGTGILFVRTGDPLLHNIVSTYEGEHQR